ncbi:sn-glycerol-3-phosphate ABC transporter ATP-binding protein UgpC [Maritimibacter sp. UBA3975]|uniref:ABC transporter ATP-binding protein n=1 Tax=Maritimibacter sp. UBA3975 TaxID=1946833 RepID=UPI000C0A7E0A|nr:sn-glycerol-3-phosphate ABC transporter ATP-binding protein UgpC [Maritimibacter sp. UBA3975]MAM62949.1 ABC transporter ATP-binding protein [Maritimibacter sp.]|tara:strand:+ start:31441 stop:32532 length:1092 start_codon:yes stop_codon:yes gene_type:complete
MSAEIDIRNLTKRYGGLTVLDDISLSIAAGEFVVFLGPSGCGKSTLLRMIAGLEDVDAGEIHLGGDRIDGLAPGKRGVAMVFQSYALYPHMSVRQNMAFGLENVGISKDEIERRCMDAAKVLEIDHLLDRKPQMLSGGQRQRVAIGRAIVKEPKAFLFDEPLSNLDAALRGRTRLELAQLHQRLGATMVFVTHDQIEAMTLADRIVIMHDKKIEQIGAPMEVYQRPATRFVAEFVGSPAMSILPAASVSAGTKGASIEVDGVGTIDSAIPLPEGFNADGASVGIRAEDTRPSDTGLPLTVQVVERLGDRTLLYGRLPNGSDLVAQDLGRTTVQAGDEVRIAVDPSAVHLFDGTGRAFHAPEEA